MRRSIFVVVLAAACSGTAAAAVPVPMTAYAHHSLPPSVGKFARDLSWAGTQLLVATESGVFSVAPLGGPAKPVIPGQPAPYGISAPSAIASDGKWVSAISWTSNSGFSERLADHKRLVAQRSVRLIAMDLAVRGDRTCVVGYAPSPPVADQTDVATWCGGPSDSWQELKPLHRIHHSRALKVFRDADPYFGGRVAIEPNGTVDVITGVEAGVFRYGPDGRLNEVLGKGVDDLVLASMGDIRGRFAADIENRYRLLLNAQPIIDDLVATPAGPAIVVRLADHDRIHWELWYPLSSGGIGTRIRLGIERIGPYGHLRCDAQGDRLACVGSLPPQKEAGIAKTAQAWPHLWLFQIPSTVSRVSR